MKKKVKMIANLFFWGGIAIYLLMLFSEAITPKWPLMLMSLGVLLSASADFFDR